MDVALVESLVSDKIVDAAGVGGGCIADARRVRLASGRTVFVKQAAALPDDAFAAEAAGLRALAACGELRIPQVVAVDPKALVLEWVDTARPGSGFMARFGRAFAALHRITGDAYGFDCDNYLGRTPQPNPSRGGDWSSYFFEERIAYQLRLAERHGYADDALRRAVAELENRIDDLLAGSEEPPTLLHGDLWGGNYLADAQQRPVLIDPAVYYGHREADLAMTRLFGGFTHEFYAAYEEAFPLSPGERRRRPLYESWHLLNHLNLFGSSYYSQSLAALRACV
jgi:fructosamine-3-kinase